MKDKMNMIASDVQKKLLLEMLIYIDRLCRENKIKYSIIAGTLIGAIRHKGFIPWDDDIDIILDRENYKRLINVLRKNDNANYKILIPNETKGYPLQFAKLVNLKTSLIEPTLLDKIDNYGLFLDIFTYNYMPNDDVERKKFYNKCYFYQRSLVRMKIHNGLTLIKKIKRFLKNLYISIFGYHGNLNKLLELYDKYDHTNYVISNNPAYGYEKEVQKSSDIADYIDVEFEGYKVMAYKNYDNILKTTFGNYMELPPVEKRRTHNLKVYWKDE